MPSGTGMDIVAQHIFGYRRRGALTTAQVDTVEDLPGHHGLHELEDVV